MGLLQKTDRLLYERLRPFRSPVLGLIAGGIFSTLTVDQVYSPGVFSFLLIGSSFLMLLGILVLLYDKIPDIVGVFIVGVSLFFVLSSFVQYNQSLRRTWINNQRLHLEGTFRPPHSFPVHKVNGKDQFLRLYFLNPPSFLKGQYTRKESQSLELTGRAVWFDLNPEFRFFLENRGYHAAVRNLQLHRADDEIRSFGWLIQWKNQLLRWIRKQESSVPYSATFLQALATGDRNFPTHLELLLRRLGMVHLFVISGFHVGLLFWFLHKVTPQAPTVMKQILIGMVLILYLGFLGWPLSATRAGVMIGLGAVAVQFNRRVSILDVLFVTVLLFMLWNPYVVFDAGFQLTIGAVLGIQLLSRPLEREEILSAGGFLRMNIGAFVGTLPVILHHFHYVAPLALPGSLLAGALFPYLLGILALQALFLLYNWSVPAQWIEWGIGQTVETGLAMVREIGWILELPEVPVLFTLVLSLTLFIAISSFLPRTIRVGAAGFAVFSLLLLGYQPGDAFLEIRQVRDANFLLMRTPDQHDVLVLPPGERLSEYQVDGLDQLLRKRGMHHLSYFVGPYNRRLFSQFDPGFTVGRYAPYWKRNRQVEWEGGYFDVGELQLQSRFVNVNFDGRETSFSFSDLPALIATTSDGRCLVGNSSQLDRETFEKLRGSSCQLKFLREGPVQYSTEEP